MTEDFATMLSNVYTMLPGKIVSWDGNTAVVRPSLPKMLSNGDILQPPQIVRVAVKFPVADAGQARITVPLKAGDDVELTFSCRSLENWLSGSDTAPDDPRQFDLSDCFATPVMRPPANADTENLVVAYGPGELKISPGGVLTYSGPQFDCDAPANFKQPVQFEDTTAFAGNASFAAGLSQGGKWITADHRHEGGTLGSGQTGGVV